MCRAILAFAPVARKDEQAITAFRHIRWPTYTSSSRGLRSGAVALTAHYRVNAVKSPPRPAKQACCSCCVVAHYRAFGLHFLSQSVYCGYYCSTDDSTVMPGNLISLHCVRKLNKCRYSSNGALHAVHDHVGTCGIIYRSPIFRTHPTPGDASCKR